MNDTVKTKDGEVYNGTITKSEGKRIKMEVRTGKGYETKTIKRKEIKEITSTDEIIK